MPLTDFQKQLENDLKKSVKLTINNNRSTMLSVRWEPDCTKVSMHKFFLAAPENVMSALACYIKQEGRPMAPSVKLFIADNIKKLDYSQDIKQTDLVTQGETYDLAYFLNHLNREYFEDRLKLNITWFGKNYQSNRSQVTFGMYHEPLKLIKINRLLDSTRFPEFFVSYVIYHEMLHQACPSYCDEKGRQHIHNKEFKTHEMRFRDFYKAKEWLKNNRDQLFENTKNRKRKLSWRAIVSGLI